MNADHHDRDIDKRDVARGAAAAALSRLGAVIEVVTQPAFTWLFGIATYGLYTALWAAVNIVENIVDLAMTAALQRAVPQAQDEAAAHAAVKIALLIGVIPATLIAVGVQFAAAPVAGLFNAAPDDRETIVTAVRIFVWALPLWTFVEIATSAVRARRAFGPEIRLRIFWEQLARLAFAVGAFAIGLHSLGLIVAHLASLAVTAAMCVQLLGRHYDLRLLWHAPVDRRTVGDLASLGLGLLPSSILARLFNDLPAVLLNMMLPGTQGATSAGLYGIARKVSTVPMIVRQTFIYVLAPLASAQARRDLAGVGPLYAFASRLSTVLVLPLAATLIALGEEILRLFVPEARAALPLLIVLVLGRAAEAIVGPASPIVEMTGHRRLPLLNSLIGLAVWLVCAAALVPPLGGLGMAVAVAVGSSVIAYAAVVELWIAARLTPFGKRFTVGFGVSAAAAAAILVVAHLTAPFGNLIEATVLLLLLPVATWIGLRFGLTRSDREALGNLGRRLRL